MIKAADGTATVTSLVESLQLGQSSVTQLVQRAETLDLVERRVVREDARSQWLKLTRRGDRILARAFTELGPERDRLLAAVNAAAPTGA